MWGYNMGFFDLKAKCSVCEQDIGLNRNRIKCIEDGWICPLCMEKCGGIFVVNSKDIKLEDLKNKVRAYNLEAKERKEILESKVNTKSMRFAEGMYNYCLENEFGQGYSRNTALNHFKIIENLLKEDEEVKVAFIGIHNYISTTKHEKNFAYVITNKRIVMAQKKVIGENIKTVSLDNINDITFTSGMVFGTLTIDTIKEKFNVALDKVRAKNIHEKVQAVLDESQKLTKSNRKQETKANENSSADEIKKFKELLDEGILTQEEFELKKKQLLGI